MDVHNFSHNSLLLAVPLLSGLFMRHMRMPMLVGYIIAGVLLGPHVLGIASSTETIEWLAELGIILLMFMIGLELDMQAFRSTVVRSCGIVLLQILLSVGALLGLSLFFPITLGFAVVIGCVIALSSTAVAITVLRDMHQEKTDAGKAATSLLIAQDLAVVPMLIMVQLVSGESVTYGHMLTAAASISVIAVTLFGIFYLTHHPRLLRRIQSIFAHGIEQPALAALACIFVASAVSGYAGLSAAYGAFALGLILRNIGDVGHAYGRAIAPLHDLLLMIFFLSIGFILDLNVLWEHAALIGAMLVTLMLLKTVGNTLLLYAFDLSWRGRLLAGSAVSQVGEFSFVILGVALSSTLLTGTQYHIGLAVIALSLVVSPVWIAVVERYAGIVHAYTEKGTKARAALREVVYEVKNMR